MKNRTMKLKVMLFLGLYLAIMAVAASPAYAQAPRESSAFSAFRVEYPIASNPYNCLYEHDGAVVNECGYPVSLEFDMPIDAAGTYWVSVQNYFQGTNKQNTFWCDTYAYPGNGQQQSGGEMYFALTGEENLALVPVLPFESIQLICWKIPSGGGVAKIGWGLYP